MKMVFLFALDGRGIKPEGRDFSNRCLDRVFTRKRRFPLPATFASYRYNPGISQTIIPISPFLSKWQFFGLGLGLGIGWGCGTGQEAYGATQVPLYPPLVALASSQHDGVAAGQIYGTLPVLPQCCRGKLTRTVGPATPGRAITDDRAATELPAPKAAARPADAILMAAAIVALFGEKIAKGFVTHGTAPRVPEEPVTPEPVVLRPPPNPLALEGMHMPELTSTVLMHCPAVSVVATPNFVTHV